MTCGENHNCPLAERLAVLERFDEALKNALATMR